MKKVPRSYHGTVKNYVILFASTHKFCLQVTAFVKLLMVSERYTDYK